MKKILVITSAILFLAAACNKQASDSSAGGSLPAGQAGASGEQSAQNSTSNTVVGFSFQSSEILHIDNIYAQTTALTQTAQPTIYPNGGDVLTKDQISLSTATTGAKIYYTIDGTTPTTNSYLYNGFVDLQPGKTYFVIGTYVVKAMAIKSGYSNSNVAQASFNVTNQDKSQRKILSDQQISINHDDCWTSDKESCTSLSGMSAATLNEIGYFAQACDSWTRPPGPYAYANRCKVYVTAGTEAGHAGTGTCSHAGGSKFDMRIETLVNNYILTPAYFTYLGIRGDGAPMYKWKSGGAIYARESSPDHWDVLIGGCK